jgi:hypothetical protein
MKTLAEAAQNISNSAMKASSEPDTQALGFSSEDGRMISPTQLPSIPQEPVPMARIRMLDLEIASMQRQGRLTISSETRTGQSAKVDADGKTYGWEFATIETGRYLVKKNNPTQSDIEALALAIAPGHRHGIQTHLEHLAQIKPIGASNVKQSTVIAYLTRDLCDAGISEFVVSELCEEHRKAKEFRFFPEHGVFFDKAKSRMKKYLTAYEFAIKPEQDPASAAPIPEAPKRQPRDPEAPMPWHDLTFEAMPIEMRSLLWNFCRGFHCQTIAAMYCRSLNISYEELKKWAE